MTTKPDICKKATIYSVAMEAGVSKSTVSLVINNDCRVAPETVEAVREVIERQGYQPKPVKNRPGPRRKGRKPVRHQQVALLFGGKPMMLHTAVYSRVVQSIESRLSEEGWNLVIRTLPKQRPWEAMPHRLDGVLLFSANKIPSRLMCALRKTSVVRIMATPKDGDFFDHVTYDDEKIGQVAAEYLLAREHRHLACVFGTGQRRSECFVRTAREAGAEVREMIPRSQPIDESGKVQLPDRQIMAEMAEEIFRMNPRPTGMYVSADIIAVGLYNALSGMGIRPGVDIEIVGTNNDAALLDHMHPRPASVDIHSEAVGRRAVEQLFWRLDHGREPLQIIKLDPEIALD